jgi:uncharacterized membrane protein YgcG
MGARRARVAAALLPLALMLTGGAAAFAAAAPTPSAVSAYRIGRYSIGLLGQPAWVGPGGTWTMRLAVSAPDPAGTSLGVKVYSPLITRTGFDQAASGDLEGSVVFTTGPTPLSNLSTDAAGGTDVSVPVAALNVAGAAVYPVEARLFDASGAPEGGPLVTFLVYSPSPASLVGFPALSVAVVLPVEAAPSLSADGMPGPLMASSSHVLASLVGALVSGAGPPVNLAISPETLTALDEGGPLDRSTLSELAGLVQGGPDVALAEPYAPVSFGALAASGLASESAEQFAEGAATLQAYLGQAPDPTTWVVQGTLDQATLSALLQARVKRLIVPESYLSPLPATEEGITFASPTYLSGTSVEVYAADAGISADLGAASSPAAGGPVLAANRLLAELAMIHLEAPGVARGVAVLPPVGWQPDPEFVSTLLAGLQSNPLLSATTASGLFHTVPVADLYRSPAIRESSGSGVGASGGGSSSGGGSYSGGGSSTLEMPASAQGVSSTRRTLGAIVAVLPGATKEVTTLNQGLLVSESYQLSPAEAIQLLRTVSSQALRLLDQVGLPAASSITLTSSKGSIPVTILAGALPAHVQLRLSSQRLIFRAAGTQGGSCRVPNPTAEICQLVLSSHNTTLKVPVQSRSSGTFALEVSLWTPSGTVMLVDHRDTIRSTTVPGVGVAIIVLAIVSLVLWWVRDLRHGRRPRRMMPPPSAAEELDPEALVSSFLREVSPSEDAGGPKARS